MTVDRLGVIADTSRSLAIGLAGGLVLGVVARVWMRLIATDPEFTWSGTLFIVGAFALFGLAQAFVFIVRRRTSSRPATTAARIVGAVATLPLFVAAGAPLAPTVIGGELAVSRVDWRRRTRLLCLGVAVIPLVVVGRSLVQDHGWSLRALGGFVGMLGIYAVIVLAGQGVTAPLEDGWGAPRWARRVGALAVCATLGVALLIAGVS